MYTVSHTYIKHIKSKSENSGFRIMNYLSKIVQGLRQRQVFREVYFHTIIKQK